MRKYIYGAIIGFVLTSLLFVLIFNDAIKYQIAYNFITSQYDGEIDSDVMDEAIFSGIVDGLGDQHSMYIGTDIYSNFMQDLTTSYEGIGVQVSISETEPYVTIQEVLENGAASEENIYAGDIILSVNGEKITSENAEDVAEMIKAEPTVKLELHRPSTDEDITINTAGKTYQSDSVHSDMYNYKGTKAGYIKIDSFVDTTAEEFTTKLSELEEKNFDKLIIDLRDNPGGELSTLTKIADEIVDPGKTYLSTKRGDKVVDSYESNLEEAKDYPIVVLQNENTASAAEILSSALQEVNGATVIGQTSYGKGSVQRLFELPFIDTAMKITIEHWYTANDEQIDQVGITPDIELEDESSEVYQIPLSENLDVGAQSVTVYIVKVYLSLLGYEDDLSSTTYTQTTANNIKEFQETANLKSNGIVDIYTAEALYNEASKVAHTPENDNMVLRAITEE